METKKHSTGNRILHWAMAFVLLLIIGTIFLRLTWLEKYNVAGIIQGYLSTTDQSFIPGTGNLIGKTDMTAHVGLASLPRLFSNGFVSDTFSPLFIWQDGISESIEETNIH